ncbi:CocE/NonD family hydrolase [Mycobacterium sp. DL592]|uniref:CocE/NonD family hydrolase n=1 Tax=Mycobacterium sp. DL592 TaxID=2675524 RepID=UPI001423B4F8|nr:CocE/NonD family hydrolase [Mycobacterium sp. DL592]
MSLGVGAALLSSGCGLAWADGSTGAAATSGTDNSSSADAGSSGSHAKATGGTRRAASDTGKVSSSGGAQSSSKHSASVTLTSPTTSSDTAPAAATATGGSAEPTSYAAVSTIAAPSTSTVGSVNPIAPTTATPATGGPAAPVDSPLALALAAFTRREAAGTLSAANVTAQTTASLTVGSNPIVVTPTLAIDNGVIVGQNYVTAPVGATLVYTLIGAPDKGGKVTFSATTDPNYVLGNFSYLPDQSVLTGATNEKFTIMVAQNTGFDQFVGSIPILGSLATPIINALHQTPILGDLLAPVIGYASFATFNSNTVLPSTAPVAYTYKMSSFDGALISVNWFPAVGLAAGDKQQTVLDGPGLATAGQTDPYQLYGISGLTAGVSQLRSAGFNVVTWDPRGEFASGGVLQLDNPFFEGRDVSAIVSWVAGLSASKLDSPGDPVVGMVGGSYGGGIQLTSAATDPRIDAIVPGIAWNSLNNSLYPDGAFKTAYGSLLLLSLITSGARINNQIYLGVLSGDLIGYLSQTAQAVLSSSGPTSLLNNLKIPVLFLQGTVDVLFTLQQAIDNAQTVLANGNTDLKMVWYCGGHGVCLTGPTSPNPNIADTITFLNQQLKGITPPVGTEIPTFQYTDQKGNWYQSTNLPVSGSPFFGTPVQVLNNADGGVLGIVPFLGGSGPGSGNPPYQATLPYSLGLASKASNAINVAVNTNGISQIVGAPTLSFDYQGLGTNRFVYAQLVDNATGLVVGNLVTPVPVTMDGQNHTATINMENIVYTVANPNVDNLTLQITSSTTAYWSLSSFGAVKISNINLTLPTPATITPETL